MARSPEVYRPALALTLATAAGELAAGLAALDAGQDAFSFSQTSSIDSSAVACMLSWQRHARQRGMTLKFEQVPVNLTHLTDLYGVADLF